MAVTCAWDHGCGQVDSVTPGTFTFEVSRPAVPEHGIQYHGGPVMLGPVNLYYIWYGDNDDTTRSVLTDFGNTLGGSRWYQLLTSYTDGNGVPLSKSLVLKGAVSVGYTQGKTLSTPAVQSIVQDVIASQALPSDTNGVYLVLTARDVVPDTTGFCGYHSLYRTSSGDAIKFGLILNARDRGGCRPSAEWTGVGPNGASGADAMASVIAHEVAETVTDPEMNGWYRGNGEGENGDLCAWNMGVTYPAANLASANIRLGSRDFLLQQLWVNKDGGSCMGDARTWTKKSYGRGAGVPLGCGPNESSGGALCYPRCRDGYHGVGPVCWGECPGGYTDTGALCTGCSGDWRPWTWHCDTTTKPSYGRGAGVPIHTCDAGMEQNGALCYPKCRAGYSGVGPVCWEDCPPEFRDEGALCSGAWS